LYHSCKQLNLFAIQSARDMMRARDETE